jgi:parallel beta-helix repeat protein
MGYYDSGIYLYNYSGNNTFDGNKIVNCYQGIFLWKSSGSNIIKSNIIANNGFGIVTSETDSDVIIRNNVTSNGEGIWINRGTNISIIQNSIVCNHLHGIRIDTNDNIVYHNNIIDNEVQAGVSTLPPASNVWDDGYPSGGNYWSDYVGVDVKRGPNQDLPGSDGLGDTPYIIDASNTDHYPLFVGAPPPPTYSLTITTTVGGTTDPVPGTYSYSANSSVQVTAIPNADYTFDHWELDTATINVYMGISYDPNYTGGVLVTSIAPGGPADKAGLIVGDVIKEIDSLQVNHAEDLIIYVERHKNPGDTVVLRINRNNLIIQITLTLERPPVGSPNPHSVLMDSNHILRALFTRTSMPAAPVGGYSLQIRVQTKTEPVLSYIALTAALAAIVTGLRPKTKRKC